MKVHIYVEGGGRGAPDKECRAGFRALLENAKLNGRMLQIVPGGSRAETFKDFQNAMAEAGRSYYPVLLVDSETAVTTDPWTHLKNRKDDQWKRPRGTAEDQAQLMVQCMETWIVADRGTLRRVFGQGFRENALPAMNDLENKSKDDVQNGLERATEGCKGPYKKGKRSFRVVAELDAGVLKDQLPHFERLHEMLNRRLAE
ncbi:MAG: DUF4276 family protein [Phycisphaerales bacterium]|nr:DUF4276 family protein [Phycisphaerales bacterium]